VLSQDRVNLFADLARLQSKRLDMFFETFPNILKTEKPIGNHKRQLRKSHLFERSHNERFEKQLFSSSASIH